MPLDPQARALLAHLRAAATPPLHTLSAPDARQAARELFGAPQPAPPVAQVEDRSIPGPAGPISIRVYTPSGDGPFAVLVYLHGGGWVFGGVDTHDPLCRGLARAVGCVVVSVDYRLAPEHPFPAPLEDGYAAVRWAARHAADIQGDAQRLAIAGDGAGGNLAAGVALMARDRGGPPLAYQLLIYPILDHAFDTASHRDYGVGYVWTQELLAWCWRHYAPHEEFRSHPQASPLQAPNLRGLPSTLLLTAECDLLRDEGAAYAERLQAAGVEVEYRCYGGMMHGFLGWASRLDTASRAVAETAAALRAALNIRDRDAAVAERDTPETELARRQDEMAQGRGAAIPAQAYLQA